MALPVTFTFTNAGGSTDLQTWDSNFELLTTAGNNLWLSASGTRLNTDTGGADIVYRYVGETAPNDQSAKITIVDNVGTWAGGGPMTRVQASGDGYMVLYAGNAIVLQKKVSGSNSDIGSAVTGTYTGGDTIELTSVGTTHTVYLNGSAIITQTDSQFASGAFGIFAAGGTGPHFDDYIIASAAASGSSTADIAATIPVPVAAISATASVTTYTESISFHGTTLYLESDQPIVSGTLYNGYPYAVRHASATYFHVTDYITGNVAVNSGRAETSGTYANGAMLDPDPSIQYQGYDGTDAGFFNVALDVGVGIANGTPLDIDPPTGSYASFCTAESVGTNTTGAGVSFLYRWVPWTIYNSDFVPPSPSTTFVPWAAGPIKQSTHLTTSQVSTAMCQNLDIESLNAYWTTARRDTNLAGLVNIWNDGMSGYQVRYIHPEADMDDYGEYFGQAGAYTMMYLQDAAKRTTGCAYAIVQQGINLYGNRKNDWWGSISGGQGQGRKGLWLAAYVLLQNNAELDPTGFDDTQKTNEDGQSYIVTETSAGVYNQGYGFDWEDGLRWTAADVGKGAWGIGHSWDIASDDNNLSGPDIAYFLINIANWSITAWSLQQMLGRTAARALWNWEAFWRCVERYIQTWTPPDAPVVALFSEYDYGTGTGKDVGIAATIPVPVAAIDATRGAFADIDCSIPVPVARIRLNGASDGLPRAYPEYDGDTTKLGTAFPSISYDNSAMRPAYAHPVSA